MESLPAEINCLQEITPDQLKTVFGLAMLSKHLIRAFSNVKVMQFHVNSINPRRVELFIEAPNEIKVTFVDADGYRKPE